MSQLISPKKIKPSGPVDAEIMFIGEAPGYEEDIQGIPFVGDTGKLFDNLLGQINLSRRDVWVTNLCNQRPNNNKFQHLIGSKELEEGINDINEHIQNHQPKWVILLGRKPLEYLAKKKKIEKWRSSVISLSSNSNFFISLHPASSLHQSQNYPLLSFDFQRLSRYIKDGYRPPIHNYTIDPKGLECEQALREIEQCKTVAVDIEGVKKSTHILCCGFATSNTRAICFANHGLSDFTFKSNLIRILENPNIEKIFQNGFGYDVEVLRLNGIDVKNYSFDTMIATHVLEPELPYGLDYLTSIYTDEPYYKDKGRSAIPDDDEKGWSESMDRDVLYDYNCTDCIVTYNIATQQKLEISERNLQRTYDYKQSLIPLSTHLSQSGLPIDEDRRSVLSSINKKKRIYYQELLNAIAGYHVNVKSGPAAKKLLLDHFNLPERRNRETGELTFDEDAIVSYLSFIQDKINDLKTQEAIEKWEYKLAVCKCFLLIRGYRQLDSNYLKIKVSLDGRARSMYNLAAATETGRGSSHRYIDGTGNNAQTWPRESFEIPENEYNNLLEIIREGR